MNKQILKFMIVVLPLLGMIGCSDDEEDIKPSPSIAIAGAPVSALPGTEIAFTVTVTAPNGGEELTVLAGSTEVASIALAGKTSSEEEIEYTIPANAVIGSTIVLTVQATDKKGLSSTSTNLSIQVNDPVVVLTGNLTSQTLDASKRYLLRSQVFIPSGVTVTIPAGTVIFGEKATRAALIVEKGGTLNCNGTAASPVVMTSNQAVGARDKGDWAGLVILGRAFTNQNTSAEDAGSPSIEGIDPPKRYGSNVRTNDAESSGNFTYLRVEYAGIELTPNNETNSITFGGVGSGTKLEHLQVSFGGDDGYEWFGGAVNAKYLVSLSTWDDDFDGDYGWSGKVQFGLIVRNPSQADQSQSNAFEIDNGPNDNDTGTGTYTTATFSNITVYGPIDRVGRSNSANNVHGMDLRRRVAASIFNSVITGFPTGLRFNQASVLANYNNGLGVLSKNILVATTAYAAGTGLTATDVQTYWTGAALGNSTMSIPAADAETAFYADLGLQINNYFARYNVSTYPSNPDFKLTSGTATLASGADFTDAKVSDAFFSTTTYRGAFDGTTDWTDGWAEFRPLSKVY